MIFPPYEILKEKEKNKTITTIEKIMLKELKKKYDSNKIDDEKGKYVMY